VIILYICQTGMHGILAGSSCYIQPEEILPLYYEKKGFVFYVQCIAIKKKVCSHQFHW